MKRSIGEKEERGELKRGRVTMSRCTYGGDLDTLSHMALGVTGGPSKKKRLRLTWLDNKPCGVIVFWMD